ncbi:MAG: hypothetical protein JHC93_00340 [Parachlamydiales bacterium]|nr:hypothetical protein [Parachlamydiales bacterium]
MINPVELESSYQEFMADLAHWIPDGPIHVDLEMLHSMGLVNANLFEPDTAPAQGTEQFYVIETSEKLTLFNNEFSVWIVPRVVDQVSTTLTLVAVNHAGKPNLELVFLTSGVYNNSRLVLGILDYFLQEVKENEDMIVRFNKIINK